MRFPLAVDLRHETLATNTAGVDVVDADNVRIMTVYPDERTGMYDRAAAIADTLNAANRVAMEASKL